MSFSIKSNLNTIKKNIKNISEEFNIFLPSRNSSGFKISNEESLVKQDLNFLEDELIKSNGFIPAIKTNSFRTHDTVNEMSSFLSYINNYPMVPQIGFLFTIQTSSGSELFKIVTDNQSTYDYTVKWGDNSVDLNQTGTISHTYITPGTYQLSIYGIFPTIEFENNTQIVSIESIGLVDSTLEKSFKGCVNIISVNTYGIGENVTNCSHAWEGCTALTEFNTKDLINVTNCNNAWEGCTSIVTFDPIGLTSVTDCENAWRNCTGLTGFDASSLTKAQQCTSSWSGCSGLTFFIATGLIEAIDCTASWYECTDLETFDTSSLTKVTACTTTWGSCTSLTSFNASGLTSSVECNNAWLYTRTWILGDTFTNYTAVSTASGWNPGTGLTDSPRT
jgi:hypothetical protein